MHYLLRHYLGLIAVVTLFVMPSCRVVDDMPADRGRDSQLEGDRQDTTGTCTDSCGGRAATGCWCNEQCVEFGDCCPDYDAVCNGAPDPGASCEGSCGGQAANGCWCDDSCTGYGDCCEDYEPVCLGQPDPDPVPDPDPIPDPNADDPWSDLSDGPLIDALGGAAAAGHQPMSYDQARNQMYGAYGGVGLDIHNGVIECIYTGLQIPPDGTRYPSSTINTEHSWPRSDGAAGAPRESDLHHLFPTEQNANSRRSSFDFGMTTCVAGGCPWNDSGSELGVDPVGKTVFEVRPPYRGDIARAHFYFSVRYHMAIPEDEEEVLRAWNDEDPPSLREQGRNDAIEMVQGNRNPFIDYPHLDDRISDF